MAYSEELAARVRALLDDRDDVSERKMFGGLCFIVGGNMACGVSGDKLMARVGEAKWEEALARKHARLMDFTGRPLRGFVYVASEGLRTRAMLAKWVDECVACAVAAPKKKTKKAKRRPLPKARARRA